MKVVVVQMRVAKTLLGEENLSTDLPETTKKGMLELTYSIIILHLEDRVLREVSKETTIDEVWSKKEQLYMTKRLTNQVYLKEKLFGFRMGDERSVEEAILILNSLPSSYSTFVEIMKYARETIVSRMCWLL